MTQFHLDVRRPNVGWAVVGGYLVLLVTVALFSLATLRDGHDWGDDFAMYIHHAKNVAEGLPYGSTGYIYNPNNPVVGPIVYPPGYPLLLAPIYKLFGLDIHAMRVELIAIFAADLALVAVLFRNHLSRAVTVVLVAALGFSPGLWRLRQEVLSDIPFLLFCLTTILILRSLEEHADSRRSARRQVLIVLLGVGAYLTFATRTVGVLLLACVVASDLFSNRRLTRLTWLPCAMFATLAALQRLTFGPFESYVDQLILSPGRLLGRVVANAGLALEALGEVGGGAAPQDPVATAFTVATVALVLVGFTTEVRARRGVFVVFPLVYVAALLLWPTFQGVRYLLPVLPFIGYFALRGLACILAPLGSGGGLLGYTGVACLLTVAYLNFYVGALNSPSDDGVFRAGAQQLFSVVREQTSRDDVFVFFKPRALALFTDRRASAYHWATSQEDLLDYLRSIDASFVIVGPEDAAWSDRYIVADPTHFTVFYSGPEFTMYRVAGS